MFGEILFETEEMIILRNEFWNKLKKYRLSEFSSQWSIFASS